MQKTKVIALSLVLALVFNMMMPFMKVVATPSYTITFTATGSHTISKEDGHLKIDDQIVDLEDSNNNVIGEVNVSSSKSGSITVSDGTAGTLSYNTNQFTLYNTDGHVEYDYTSLDSSSVFMVEDYTNTNPPAQSSGLNIKYLRDAGDVWYRFDNKTETKVTTDTSNISVPDGTSTMTIRIEDRTIGASLLFINGTQQSATKTNFINGYTFNVNNGDNISFEIEYINDSGSGGNSSDNINLTAGNGTYTITKYNPETKKEEEVQKEYDAKANVFITKETDTTVDITFETLWINRFYEDIVINGAPYTVSEYIDFDDRTEWLNANHGTQTISFTIPNIEKEDEYDIVIKHGENTGKKYLATFLWTADPNQAGGYDYIGNSKLEFVKAVYEVGGVKYTVTEEDLEGKLKREGQFETATSTDGFLNYGITADVDYDDGSLTLPGGAEVTMRVVPDYGYQVTSVNGDGEFTTTDSGVSEFTVTVEDGTAGYFQATVEKVDNSVDPISEKVRSGDIALGDSANADIKNGTVRLSVDDVELTNDKIANFKEKANEAGNYIISNYLDINLDKVLYRGSADSVWVEPIHHLTDKALVTLQLEEGVDVSNIVIVHNIDDGDEFEIIPIESYDEKTNTISFYTDSFSNYAIATKTTTKNPSTGDNIIATIIMFAVATIGAVTTIKLSKKYRTRKQ